MLAAMKRSIAVLFLVAGVALLVAWFAGRQAAPEPGPQKKTDAEAAKRESGDTTAWSAKPAAGAAPGGDAAGASAAPAEAAPAAGNPKVDTKAGLGALARVAATARTRAAARAEGPTPFAADKDGIRGAMRAAQDKLKECYDPWVAMNPQLQGKMTTSYVIGGEGGAPGEVHITEGGLGSEALDGCVLSVLEGELRFEPPASGEPITVRYPLIFSNGEADQPSADPG
jgi:hypothetical protein